MKVNYKNTFGDLVAFLWHSQTRSPVQMGIILLISGFISWQGSQSSIGKHHMAIIAVAWLMVTTFIFVVLLIPAFLISILGIISKKNKPFFADKFIELTENNIITESRYGRSELAWGIVQKLKRTRHVILIYTGQSVAIVIPKRAFTNEQDWDAFYSFLETHRKSRG